ncbi:hypothetical protein HMPREF0262_03106 [Clostridium sp. ATCC 29733]|nr:hypothetical protein HMPREF0262_03106 [Clostridium sp. ATCC 29733]
MAAYLTNNCPTSQQMRKWPSPPRRERGWKGSAHPPTKKGAGANLLGVHPRPP